MRLCTCACRYLHMSNIYLFLSASCTPYASQTKLSKLWSPKLTAFQNARHPRARSKSCCWWDNTLELQQGIRGGEGIWANTTRTAFLCKWHLSRALVLTKATPRNHFLGLNFVGEDYFLVQPSCQFESEGSYGSGATSSRQDTRPSEAAYLEIFLEYLDPSKNSWRMNPLIFHLLIHGSKNINRTVLKEIAKIQSHQFPRSATAASATRHVGLAKMRGFSKSRTQWPAMAFRTFQNHFMTGKSQVVVDASVCFCTPKTCKLL